MILAALDLVIQHRGQNLSLDEVCKPESLCMIKIAILLL